MYPLYQPFEQAVVCYWFLYLYCPFMSLHTIFSGCTIVFFCVI